jgi:hypothetical protein
VTTLLSDVEIPIADGGSPMLLLHRLQNPIDHTSYTEALRRVKEYLISVIYGTSGSGRTRIILEMLAQHLGLYFASDVTLSTNFASKDMFDMLTKLQERLVISQWTHNQKYVTR